MLKFIITLVLLLGIFESRSQSIVVKSFRWLDPIQIAGMPSPDKDLNGKKCAIIKVETNQFGFEFDFGSPEKVLATVQKAGEIWFWVPEGTQKVTISNKQSGVLCNYPFGKELESPEVYVLVLNTEKLTTSGESKVEVKWLTLDSSPLGADITIDGFPAGQTPYFGSLTLGSHNLEMKLNGEKKAETITVEKAETPAISLAFEADSTKKNDSTNVSQAEQNSEFKGGSKEMQKFLKANLQFPGRAQAAGIKGTVFVQFNVSETGKISGVKVIRGIGGGCDEEVVRVVNLMPKWTPLRIGGRAVPCLFTLPVKFTSLGIINRG